jgi:hypothetical protein
MGQRESGAGIIAVEKFTVLIYVGLAVGIESLSISVLSVAKLPCFALSAALHENL